jgi:predicted 2-oxoglutarate/Fe(II)-dependent dioxygenase YbiX/peroxiredoxin
MLGPGDPIPSLYLSTDANPRYAFDSVAGRYVVVMFVGGLRVPGVAEMLRQLYASAGPFDDQMACCFVVTCDPADAAEPSLRDRYPGIRIVRDHNRDLARLFGCAQPTGEGVDRLSLMTWVLDPGLRVLDVMPVEDAATHIARVVTRLDGLASPAANIEGCAPVLQVPNLFEPEFCRRLITYAKETGLQDSGYMKTDSATGQTMMIVDHAHKRRSDCNIEDEELRDAIQARIVRRLLPPIERVFQFKVSRMERYIVGCYDAQSGGYFRPHKDNTTLGTAHRRFAVTINLNAGDYEGGDLRFPEFGMRTYRAPTGGAIVFSCSLLHEATPITRGQRYCVLPFLYDEAAAAIRLENARHLQDPVLREQVVASVLDTPSKAA